MIRTPPVSTRTETYLSVPTLFRSVELPPSDRPVHLAVVAPVALQRRLATEWMHHASAHHHRLVEHGAVGVCGAQGVQAAFGQCKVDQTASGEIGRAHV